MMKKRRSNPTYAQAEVLNLMMQRLAAKDNRIESEGDDPANVHDPADESSIEERARAEKLINFSVNEDDTFEKNCWAQIHQKIDNLQSSLGVIIGLLSEQSTPTTTQRDPQQECDSASIQIDEDAENDRLGSKESHPSIRKEDGKILKQRLFCKYSNFLTILLGCAFLSVATASIGLNTYAVVSKHHTSKQFHNTSMQSTTELLSPANPMWGIRRIQKATTEAATTTTTTDVPINLDQPPQLNPSKADCYEFALLFLCTMPDGSCLLSKNDVHTLEAVNVTQVRRAPVEISHREVNFFVENCRGKLFKAI